MKLVHVRFQDVYSDTQIQWHRNMVVVRGAVNVACENFFAPTLRYDHTHFAYSILLGKSLLVVAMKNEW